MNQLRTKVAIITGGGSGIGAATAERIAEQGASVMVTEPQLSVAVATPLPALDSSAVHSMVTSAGTLRTGAVMSPTVMVWVTSIELQPSLTV